MDELLSFIKSLVGIDETDIEQYTSAGIELIKNIKIDGMKKCILKSFCYISVNGVYLRCTEYKIIVVINNKMMRIDDLDIFNSYCCIIYNPGYDEDGHLLFSEFGDYLYLSATESIEWLFDQKTTKSANNLISC